MVILRQYTWKKFKDSIYHLRLDSRKLSQADSKDSLQPINNMVNKMLFNFAQKLWIILETGAEQENSFRGYLFFNVLEKIYRLIDLLIFNKHRKCFQHEKLEIFFFKYRLDFIMVKDFLKKRNPLGHQKVNKWN